MILNVSDKVGVVISCLILLLSAVTSTGFIAHYREYTQNPCPRRQFSCCTCLSSAIGLPSFLPFYTTCSMPCSDRAQSCGQSLHELSYHCLSFCESYLKFTDLQLIQCVVNVQHDCQTAPCLDVMEKATLQERRTSTVTWKLTHHNSTNMWLLDTHSIHNYQAIKSHRLFQRVSNCVHVLCKMQQLFVQMWLH